MNRVLNGLIDAIKAMLGIKSPSRDLMPKENVNLKEIVDKERINEVETIDLVKHGHWYMDLESHWIYRCSVCDRVSAKIIEGTDYCPNCGAKMNQEARS